MKTLDKYFSLINQLLNDPRRFFDMVLARYGIKKHPLYRIPESLNQRFTLDGKIKVISGYIDDTQSEPTCFSKGSIQCALDKIKRRETGMYGGVDSWLYDALEKHDIAGKRVAIIGTADQGYGPWYECICMHYGGTPVTIEYNDIIYEDERLTAIHPSELEDGQMKFDAAFSISSIEHDGLGRYGDPINPEGDLQSMREWKRYVRTGGLCPNRYRQGYFQCQQDLRQNQATSAA